MVLCLGEPPRRFLWCWLSFLVFISFLYLYFVVVLYLSFFFILFPGYFTTSPALHPGFSGPWSPPPALISTLTTFDCIFVFIYCKRCGFELAFFTHRRFLPYAPSPTFYLRLSRPPWELGILPWSLQGFILILETQTRPICLFDSQ